MNTRLRSTGLAVLLAAASTFAMTTLPPASAAEKPPQVRREIGNPLNDAMKLTDAKDFAGALAKVQMADQVKDKTPFEEYNIAKYLGFIAINQPMPDYKAAADAYNREIASGGVPDAEKASVYNVAMRLNYQLMDYPKVIQDAVELQKVQPLDDTGYLVLIQSYYSTMDFPNAVTAAKAEVAAKTAAGGKPSADVLGLLMNAQLKSKDEAGARQTLDQLASVSTKPEVWSQVIDLTLGTKGLSDHQILNLYRLSTLTGTMKDTDYAAMATIDLQNGLPAEAKATLTKGGKTGDLMNQANSFLAKDQAALPGLAAEANKHKDGEIDVKLGESYWEYGRFDDAVASIQKGIGKGGLKDPVDAQTTLGIALLSAGKKDMAEQAFEKAAAGGTPGSSVAHVWGLYLKRAAA